MTQLYEYIFLNLDFNNRIKIINLSDYLGYQILTNKKLWNNIEIYNPKGYKNILSFIKNINNKPSKVLCVACGKLKINLNDYDLSQLNHLDLSNSRVTLDNFLNILYRCKLKKLYIKRVNFYNIMRHITNTQKDTLEELDISISKKYTFSFTSYNLDRISKLQNLKVLKLNNNNISTGLFIQLLQLKNLEVLEMIDCVIDRSEKTCLCYKIKHIIEDLKKLKIFTVGHDVFCQNTNEILKLNVKNFLIL
jgi:hypothetical protein